MREVFAASILQKFDQEHQFFEWCYWFKFNNLGLALGIALKFYNSVVKGLNLKVRKFWGLLLQMLQGKSWQGSLAPHPE